MSVAVIAERASHATTAEMDSLGLYTAPAETSRSGAAPRKLVRRTMPSITTHRGMEVFGAAGLAAGAITGCLIAGAINSLSGRGDARSHRKLGLVAGGAAGSMAGLITGLIVASTLQRSTRPRHAAVLISGQGPSDAVATQTELAQYPIPPGSKKSRFEVTSSECISYTHPEMFVIIAQWWLMILPPVFRELFTRDEISDSLNEDFKDNCKQKWIWISRQIFIFAWLATLQRTFIYIGRSMLFVLFLLCFGWLIMLIVTIVFVALATIMLAFRGSISHMEK